MLWKVFILIFISKALLISFIASAPPRPGNKGNAANNKQENEDISVGESATSLPEEAAEQALNVYNYRYNNTDFYYQNNQFQWGHPSQPAGLTFQHECMNHYFKCIMSQSSPEPVCAFNNPHREGNRFPGYVTVDSSCAVHFENCRRGFRAFLIVDTGICQMYHQGPKDHVAKDLTYVPNYQPYRD